MKRNVRGMKFKYFRQQMLLPKEEYIINRWVNIQGTNVLLLSFTVEEDKSCLWVMHKDEEIYVDHANDELSNEFNDDLWEYRPKTNREKFLRAIEQSKRYKHINIREMEIQGHTVNFDTSSGGALNERNIKAWMQLQHFAEKGLISSDWDEVDVENIFITRYEQAEGQAPLSIDNEKELSITLHIDKDFKQIPIQTSFKLRFGRQNKGTKVIYYDPVLGRENYVFIDEIYSYDVYEDTLKKIEQIEDIQTREELLKNYEKALESVCPRDKYLAVIKYETADDIQFSFMMKDYLEAETVYSNSNLSIAFVCKSDEIGINGNRVRECVMQPIDKNFNGELEIELFSRYVQLPEETVYVNKDCCNSSL